MVKRTWVCDTGAQVNVKRKNLNTVWLEQEAELVMKSMSKLVVFLPVGYGPQAISVATTVRRLRGPFTPKPQVVIPKSSAHPVFGNRRAGKLWHACQILFPS